MTNEYTPNSPTVALAKSLIAIESITPHDNGCQAILQQRLIALGFIIENFNFNGVTNFYAKRGTGTPNFCFAGHTDVVPPGELNAWSIPPFTPTIQNGFLYGRGSADMKAALASMLLAVEQFIAQNPDHLGSISFLITSDEEGVAQDGTKRVVEVLRERGESITYCVIGESSSDKILGDTIKVGRRGSLNAKLTIFGTQGHIAYPHLADNAIHNSLTFLQNLIEITWDNGCEYFPKTSLQLSNIHGGTNATNVIPGQVIINFNLRFNPLHTAEQIKAKINYLATTHNLNYDIQWELSGNPFLTNAKKLIAVTTEAIEKITHLTPTLSTTGGTSDGRFIATLPNIQVIEFGHINATIHKVNECVKVIDCDLLTAIYQELLTTLLRK